MRLSYLFAFILLLSSLKPTQAQFQENDWMIGGTLDADFINDENFSGDRFLLRMDPMAGYFFSPRFAAGASIPLSFTQVNTDEGDLDIFTVGLLPFARYYFSRGERTGIFGQAAFGYGSANFKTENYEESRGVSYWRAQLGADFFLNRHVAIELLAGYKGQDLSGDDPAPVHNFGLSVGVQVFLPCAKTKKP